MLDHLEVEAGLSIQERLTRDTTRETLGGNGITDDPPMRPLVTVETVYTDEGTDDSHPLVLGQDVTDTATLE